MTDKKYLLSIYIICAISLTSCAQKKSYLHTSTSLPSRGMCAHRGAMDTHPENTITAFKTAVEVGAQMIELDLWFTSDKHIVVIHDFTVDRTTNGKGNVGNYTLDEIKKLDAGKWKGKEFEGIEIPTFEEALSVLPYNVWINVHIKGTGELPIMAARIIEQTGRLHQAFLACGIEAAKQAKEVVPGIMICNMERKGTPSDYVRSTIEAKADFIQIVTIDYPEIYNDLKLLKENNVKVNYFGTDSPELIRELIAMGVDFPLVNNILDAQEIAKDLGISPVIPIFNKKKS